MLSRRILCSLRCGQDCLSGDRWCLNDRCLTSAATLGATATLVFRRGGRGPITSNLRGVLLSLRPLPLGRRDLLNCIAGRCFLGLLARLISLARLVALRTRSIGHRLRRGLRHRNLSRAGRWRPGRRRRIHRRSGCGGCGRLRLGRLRLLVPLLLIFGSGALDLAILPVALSPAGVATLSRNHNLVDSLDGRAPLTHGVVPAVTP